MGAKNAWGFDLMAACSGFLYALTTGSQFIESGKHKKVVVVGGDKMSSIIDYEDRATCIIFGDGCGAVLLEPSTEGLGVMDSHPTQRWQRLPVPAPEGRWQHASGHERTVERKDSTTSTRKARPSSSSL
jgi:3-oxoacyl-[acyl-carrier-protein] synthase III